MRHIDGKAEKSHLRFNENLNLSFRWLSSIILSMPQVFLKTM